MLSEGAHTGEDTGGETIFPQGELTQEIKKGSDVKLGHNIGVWQNSFFS